MAYCHWVSAPQKVSSWGRIQLSMTLSMSYTPAVLHGTIVTAIWAVFCELVLLEVLALKFLLVGSAMSNRSSVRVDRSIRLSSIT